MIKKSIITAIVLIAAYEAVIRLCNIKWDTSQNDKSANVISAQNFIYNLSNEQTAADTLIIGSSMSRKLITDSLGKSYYNLAFNAWSAYDGLELVKLTKRKPACLLIETNVVGNQSLSEAVSGSLSPVSFYSNKVFTSFQLQHQPVGLLVGSIKEALKAKIEAMKLQKRQDTALYKLNIANEKKVQQKPLHDSVYENRFAVLKNLVEGFKKQGIPILFFELPVDTELMHTAMTEKNRQYFKKYFPESEYTHIALPAENNYVYSDGIHLSINSAVEYTQYLKTKINQLKTNK